MLWVVSGEESTKTEKYLDFFSSLTIVARTLLPINSITSSHTVEERYDDTGFRSYQCVILKTDQTHIIKFLLFVDPNTSSSPLKARPLNKGCLITQTNLCKTALQYLNI